MTKLIIILTLALGAISIDTSPAAAESCTDGYVQCLNDSWDLDGALQKMADIECAAEYTGCVASKLRFW